MKLSRIFSDFRPGMALALSFALVFSNWILPSTAQAASAITAIWANTGEDKVTRDDLRATRGTNVTNSIWNGTTISIFGGKNEVVSFNLILEAGSSAAGNVTVSFNRLTGPSGATISSSQAAGDGVFNWVGRNIELFYVRYLQINGLSLVSYSTTVDERQVPQRMERPWTGAGAASGGWTNRPDHNKFYPDIAVPLELVPNFNITAGQNQSIWVDVYIPKNAISGLYLGNVVVQQGGVLVQSIPVQLKVYNFTLPDSPNAKTMMVFDSSNINQRFLGSTYVNPASAAGAKASLLRDRYIMLAHRHRISLIGDNLSNDCSSTADQPCPDWGPRLTGSLFTASNGYDGPGVSVGNNVYSIGTYGAWSWNTGTQAAMNTHTNNWATWFNLNAPSAEYFLYLDDESPNYTQTQQWAQWILSNPGAGRQVKSMATVSLVTAASQTPSLDIPTSNLWEGITAQWQAAANSYTNDARKRFYMYNGHHPASGSFAIEDDGIALRELAWGQYKKHINRWYFWESTYYNNYQGSMGQTNVFENAQTFGTKSSADPVMGATGWNYSNGDGVLMYPGTDTVYPADSYGVDGPFASLRLKHWRRGIQDVDYLTMAAAVNPAAVQVLVSTMVPKVLWEYGVDNASDPTYVHTALSWSNNPDVWENARAQLANIIAPDSLPGPLTGPATVTLSSPTLNSFVLSWSTVTSIGNAAVAVYQVQLSTMSNFAEFINNPWSGLFYPATTTSTPLIGLLSGTAYFVRVRANDAAGNSTPYSAPVTSSTLAAISAPSTIYFNYPNTTTLRLYWGASTDNAGVTGYRIDLATDSGFVNPVPGFMNENMGNTLTVNLSGLTPATTYYARARAYDAAGNISGNTGTATMATLNANYAALSAPVDVTLASSALNTLSMSWMPSTAAGSITPSVYQVQLSTNATFSDFIGNPWAGFFYAYPTESATLSGLQTGTLYYARVRANDTYGNASNFSSPTFAAGARPGLTSMDFALSALAARVYPNPWRRDRHQGFDITFDQLGLGATVKIFTVSGRWVATLDVSNGIAHWNLTTDSGANAASGLYLYLVTNGQGQTAHGEFAVIR